ncbi:MAG: hypothetical protein ACXABY_04635 [Candidatus Thorarchaeota archaeon]|jgi:hypothetical protein
MIKVKRIELAEYHNKLAQFNNSGVELPARASFALAALLGELNDHILAFKKHRLSLIDKYQDDPDGFNKESFRLMLEEVELESDPIPVELLDDVSLTLVHARQLQKFVTSK